MAEETALDPEIFLPGLPVTFDAPKAMNFKGSSFIRGFKDKQYLIVDHPVQNNLPAILTDGTPCIIRFIKNGSVYGFKSQVLSTVKKPCYLVFLTFPEKIESSCFRSDERYPIKLEVVCAGHKLEGQVETHPRDWTMNLSRGGMLINAYEPFERWANIYVTIFLPDQGQINDLMVQVRKTEKKGNKFLLGVSFADQKAPNYQEVRKFLEHVDSLRSIFKAR